MGHQINRFGIEIYRKTYAVGNLRPELPLHQPDSGSFGPHKQMFLHLEVEDIVGEELLIHDILA